MDDNQSVANFDLTSRMATVLMIVCFTLFTGDIYLHPILSRKPKAYSSLPSDAWPATSPNSCSLLLRDGESGQAIA